MDVISLAEASPPSSAVARSSNLTIRANSSSIVTRLLLDYKSHAAWFPLSGVSVDFPAILAAVENCHCSVAYW